MNILFKVTALLVILYVVAVENEDDIDNTCYKNVGTIKFRFGIPEFKTLHEGRNNPFYSPMFPVDANSETSWRLMLYPKGTTSNPTDVGAYVCVENYHRIMELATARIYLLDEKTREYENGPVYFSNLQYFDRNEMEFSCKGTDAFFPISDVDQYLVENDTLSTFVEVQRYYKVPECLENGDPDLGPGWMNYTFDVGRDADEQCRVKTTTTRTVPMVWMANFYMDSKCTNITTSPLYPPGDDIPKWQMKLIVSNETGEVNFELDKAIGEGDQAVLGNFKLNPLLKGRNALSFPIWRQNFTAEHSSVTSEISTNFVDLRDHFLQDNGSFVLDGQLYYIEDTVECFCPECICPEDLECCKDGHSDDDDEEVDDDEDDYEEFAPITRQINEVHVGCPVYPPCPEGDCIPCSVYIGHARRTIEVLKKYLNETRTEVSETFKYYYEWLPPKTIYREIIDNLTTTRECIESRYAVNWTECGRDPVTHLCVHH